MSYSASQLLHFAVQRTGSFAYHEVAVPTGSQSFGVQEVEHVKLGKEGVFRGEVVDKGDLGCAIDHFRVSDIYAVIGLKEIFQALCVSQSLAPVCMMEKFSFRGHQVVSTPYSWSSLTAIDAIVVGLVLPLSTQERKAGQIFPAELRHRHSTGLHSWCANYALRSLEEMWQIRRPVVKRERHVALLPVLGAMSKIWRAQGSL